MPARCRLLCLDGGGAKGVYTLGILQGLEGLLGAPLSRHFDLIYGTSTGSIIGALLGLGYRIEQIHTLYRTHVVEVMRRRLPSGKSAALAHLTGEIFGNATFDAFQTGVGIVATGWAAERPLIFKTHVAQAHGDRGNFQAGFGCRIADAVQASCSAYPFFARKTIRLGEGQALVAADGGYCANNPTLYAIADATRGLGVARADVRVVSLGVGEYPAPQRWLSIGHWLGYLFTVRLLQKVLEINTQSMDQLRKVLFADVPTVRISQAYTQPIMAADLFESDPDKLALLYQRGRESFRSHEHELRALLEVTDAYR
jgi:patatin-like phospholipase/acyl hydrolase